MALDQEPTSFDPSEPVDGAPEVFTERKSSTTAPYRPGEMDVVEFVEQMYEDASDGREDQANPKGWDKNLDVYWGDQWPADMPTYKPPIVINQIKSLLLQELSDLTDSRIQFFVQKNAGTEERDKNVEVSMQAFWRRNFCDLAVLDAALDAMIYPLGFLQSGWNPSANRGLGELYFKSRSPETVFPDPEAEDEEFLRYFILRDTLDLLQIRRDFPETGWNVEPEDGVSEKMPQRERPRGRGGVGYTGPLYTRTTSSSLPGYKKARAVMKTCVVDDPEIEERIKLINGSLKQTRELKYPNKRMIITANQRVLYNDDCPYLYAPILTRILLQPAVHTYWPRNSPVNEYAEIQSAANKLDSLVVENAIRMNLGETFADADAGLDPKTYGGLPGGVYLHKPGAQVKKSYPPPMPPDMIQAGGRLRDMIRENMGYPLSRTGAGTHGNVAAELAETEISQSMGLTRLRGRLLYQSVQKASAMIFARMAQFYTSPRPMPHIENGKWKSVKWEPVATPEEYVVHVDESTFKVQSKTMFQRLSMALAKMNKLPTKDLLVALEYPDAEGIASRLTAELMLAAKARQKGGRPAKGG